MAYLDQARTILSGDAHGTSDTDSDEALDGVAQQLAEEQRRMRCLRPGAAAGVGKADAALAGHYYLSGVMETGSELRLGADGRFDWYISYGVVDQVARGRWGRTGETVTLAADLPAADAPLLRADQTFPWDEDAERRLRKAARDGEAEAIAQRCPWSVAAASSPPLILPEDRPPPGPAEQARAAEAMRAAQAARDKASRAMARAVAADVGEADRMAADAAMSAWYEAAYDMEQAHRAANMPRPDIGSPLIPAQCQIALEDADAPIPSSQWQGGVSVVVGDPARELRLSRVAVTFVFNDGHREVARTGQGGWAFARRRQGAAVEQLVLALPDCCCSTISGNSQRISPRRLPSAGGWCG